MSISQQEYGKQSQIILVVMYKKIKWNTYDIQCQTVRKWVCQNSSNYLVPRKVIQNSNMWSEKVLLLENKYEALLYSFKSFIWNTNRGKLSAASCAMETFPMLFKWEKNPFYVLADNWITITISKMFWKPKLPYGSVNEIKEVKYEL